MIRAIASDDFAPFGKFQMDFPAVENKPDDLAEVHLLTGVNGTGKTRILALLAAVLGGGGEMKRRINQPFNIKASDNGNKDAKFSSFQIQRDGGLGLNHPVDGNFFGWLRNVPAFSYRGIAFVSDSKIAVMAGIPKPDRASCLLFSRPEQHSEKLLQAIANLKIQAALDTQDTPANSDNRTQHIMSRLERTLTQITGHAFSFSVTTHPQPAVIVKWANAKMAFNSLPDGLRSLIGWLVDAVVMMDVWLEGKGKINETEAIFLLDEVECHLHPVWQRRILPAFQHLFPKAQIFVATHSPFVISSLTCGWIHPLKMEDNGSVTVVTPLIRANAGESYISVLEDVMGLKEWYDPETEKLLSEFRNLRDKAFGGDMDARLLAEQKAHEIGKRSVELQYTMGQELNQMEKRLGKQNEKIQPTALS